MIIEKCLGEETSPCKAACPLHVDVMKYVDFISHHNYLENLLNFG